MKERLGCWGMRKLNSFRYYAYTVYLADFASLFWPYHVTVRTADGIDASDVRYGVVEKEKTLFISAAVAGGLIYLSTLGHFLLAEVFISLH